MSTVPAAIDAVIAATEPCPCGRMDKPAWSWLCRICYLEKEIRYAVSELERDGEAWPGLSWHAYGLMRLEALIA